MPIRDSADENGLVAVTTFRPVPMHAAAAASQITQTRTLLIAYDSRLYAGIGVSKRSGSCTGIRLIGSARSMSFV